MGATMPVCLARCQPGSQVTQSGTGAVCPSGASCRVTLGPGSPCTSDGKPWVWMSALLGASQGVLFCWTTWVIEMGAARAR